MKVGHKIIVEGIDGSGKTTYINNFVKEHPNYKVIHCTRQTPNTYEYFKDLLLSEDDIIFDRFCYGQFVYQTSEERLKREWLTISDLTELESIILDYDFKVVYVMTDPENALYACKKDSEDSYYNLEYINTLMRKYSYLFENISSVSYELYYNKWDLPLEEQESSMDYRNFDYSSLPKVAAVDFDGTLVYGKPFPEIGQLNTKLVHELFEGKYKDYKKILFTHRCGDNLIEACNFLADNNIHFDAVNDDIPEIKDILKRDPINNRKIWFDVIIDDKADISDIIYD